MIITFAGTIIARERLDGGTDGVKGFAPTGKQKLQVQEFLRAADATPLARGNRLHTLKGTVMPAPFATPGDAVLSLLLKYAGLPCSGTLQFSEGGNVVRFATATLESFQSERDGCSYTVDLTFQASGPAQIATAGTSLATDSGDPLATDAGNLITPDPVSP